VIVGCLPAFKSLIANRAATQRSNHGYSSGRSKSKVNSNSKLRKTSIPLELFSNDTKCVNGWHPSGADSQEEMVKPDDAHVITVKNDVVSATNCVSITIASVNDNLLLTCFREVDCLIC
jgi:hypothetical protein